MTSDTRTTSPIGPAGRGPAFSLGALVLGGGALVLMVFLAIGFLLPSDWEVSVVREMDAGRDDIFDFLDSPEGWRSWTTWPEGGLVRSGPERGAGASISWDDPEVGRGAFDLVRSEASERVEYAVEFGQAMRASGVVFLQTEGSRTLVEWTEKGDLGWNPLMGYWALFMEKGQTQEMEKSLDRLAALAEGEGEGREEAAQRS